MSTTPFIEPDNSDITYLSKFIEVEFRSIHPAMQPNAWYPLIRFDTFLQSYYNSGSGSSPQVNFYIKILSKDGAIDYLPDSGANMIPVYQPPFWGQTNAIIEYSLITTDASSVSKFMPYRNQKFRNPGIETTTNNFSFEFGFYEGVLHLFARKNGGSASWENFPLLIKYSCINNPNDWYSIDQYIKVFGTDMQLNIVENLSISTANITFINSVTIPEVKAIQLRSELNFSHSSFTDIQMQAASESWDFPDSNHAVFYFGNRYNYHGLFVGEVHRLINRSATIRFVGSTAQRPDLSDIGEGFKYFDTDLKQQITKVGTEYPEWVDAQGYPAGIQKLGTFAQRPIPAPLGYMYLCVDRKSAEAPSGPGIPLWHGGNDTWLDALGRIVS